MIRWMTVAVCSGTAACDSDVPFLPQFFLFLFCRYHYLTKFSDFGSLKRRFKKKKQKNTGSPQIEIVNRHIICMLYKIILNLKSRENLLTGDLTLTLLNRFFSRHSLSFYFVSILSHILRLVWVNSFFMLWSREEEEMATVFAVTSRFIEAVLDF